MDFLTTVDHPPQTILTTAYHQHALEAFEVNVIDYLMKPIWFPRFLQAVNKLSKDTKPKQPSNSPAAFKKDFHFFNVNKKMVKVFFDDILYIESLKDYSQIVTTKTKLVVRGQIGEMEQMLKEKGFLRIHRSYIVSLARITAFTATIIEIDTKQLPIGRSYKEWVAQTLTRFYLI